MLGLAAQSCVSRVVCCSGAVRRDRLARSTPAAARHEASSAEDLSRRALLAATAAVPCSLLLPAAPAGAIQGTIAGRIPGLTGPNGDGYYKYTRPEGKSGGCTAKRH